MTAILSSLSGFRSGRMRAGLGALALLAGTTAASPAFAQDYDWTGFRVEVVTGYDDEGVDLDDDVLDGGKDSQSGWLYGFGGGYDFQMGGMVLGLEAELTEST